MVDSSLSQSWAESEDRKIADERGIPKSWRPKPPSQVWSDDYRPPEPSVGTRIDGQAIFYPGKIHTVYGRSEHLKSMATQLVAKQVLEADGVVTYIDFESDQDEVEYRFRSMGLNPRHLDRWRYVRPTESIIGAFGEDQEALAAYLLELTIGSTLVILDGLIAGSSMEKLGMANEDVARFINAILTPLIEDGHGPAVVTIDHLPKGRADRGPIGAVSKMNLVYVGILVDNIQVVVPGSKTGVSRIIIEKDKGGALRAASAEPKSKSDRENSRQIFGILVVDSDKERTRLDVNLLGPEHDGIVTRASRPTHVMQEVSRFVEDRIGDLSLDETHRIYASKSIIEKGIQDRRVAAGNRKGDVKVIRAAIGILTAEGHLRHERERNVKAKFGNQPPLYLMEEYRESADPASRIDQLGESVRAALQLAAAAEQEELDTEQLPGM